MKDTCTNNNDTFISEDIVLHYIPTGSAIIVPITEEYKILAHIKPIDVGTFDEEPKYKVNLSICKNVKPYMWHEFEDDLILTSPKYQIYTNVMNYIKSQYQDGNLSIHMYTADRVYSLMEKSGDYLCGMTDDLSDLEGGD